MNDKRARTTRWRELADRYRQRAALAPSGGSRLALGALAQCADDVADHLAAACGVARSNSPAPGLQAAPDHPGKS